MATTLYGYGPHLITADGDYDLACVRTDRPVLLTLGAEFLNSYDGTVSIKSRKRGATTHTFKTQAYVKPDGEPDTADIVASTNVQIDVTGKDIRITTSGRTQGTLDLRPGLDSEV